MIGFILTRQWRDTPEGISLELWLSSDDGPVKLTVPNQQALFFVRQSDRPQLQTLLTAFPSVLLKPLELKNIDGEAVMGVYCQQQRQLRVLCDHLRAQDVQCWESDIRPVERFLMERFITSSLEAFPDQLLQRVSAQHVNTEIINHQKIVTQQVKTVAYQPELFVASIDIETSMDAKDLYSIAVYTQQQSLVFMLGDAPESQPHHEDGLIIDWCEDARDCLQKFLAWIAHNDPDILIGWYVVQFDCWVLAKLCERWGVPFTLGRDQQLPYWRVDAKDMDGIDVAFNDKATTAGILDRKRRYLHIPGRVVLDGIELLRVAFYHFDSFSLQAVASELLGDSKLLTGDDRGQKITDLFYSKDSKDNVALEKKVSLAKYNLHDCKLVWDIFEKTKLLDFAIARSRLTGMPLDKMGGSVASFEYAYLPKLHRRGYVAPNLGELESDVVSPGGYVMRSLPGLYRHVLVLDFKSLYPSIIRTFAIDPYAFWYASHQQLPKSAVVDGFNGAFFARENAILPDVIADLWAERDKAKAVNDQPLSQAIKIIMNSFYGVLGSPGCRFFDPRVCSSITLRGHEIIQKSHAWIEQQGYQVIYGDTDSLFVWLGADFDQQKNPLAQAQAIGRGLAAGLNVWWQEYLHKKFAVNSALEIEFETHYHDFLMPTIRGSEEGSKKRYAGTVMSSPTKKKNETTHDNDELTMVFKGLETVRTDWTPLAKDFQQTLYKMIFDKKPYQAYIRLVVADILSGQRDDDLIYRKRLRRLVAGYEKSNPPHVKAAKKLEQLSQKKLGKGDAIHYLITLNGPEPMEYRSSTIDYQHYIDKQIKPIADSILCFLGDSFEGMVQKQIALL
ncbi:MAG: DNA polymerase-2 [Candidatus Endobugula sp.]|jgi:DNA polymerase-2